MTLIGNIKGLTGLTGSVASYTVAELKAATTPPTLIYINEGGKKGFFFLDPSDTTTANDDAMCIVRGTDRYKRDYETIVMPSWFGAKFDGITDDTVAIQNAIDALKSSEILDGGNNNYLVNSLQLKSNMSIRNFNLKTKSQNVNFISPITIDGISSIKKNIYIQNINIDGNRAEQISLPVSGFSEDGGRNGFRVLGNVENLVIDGGSANYCANDGISLFSGATATNNDINQSFKNVIIKDFTSNWNRRHGMSFDSIDGLKLLNITCRYNGKDLNSSDVASVGTRGARSNGFLYGNGIDIEDYGVGTRVSNIFGDTLDCRNNSYSGIVIYSPVSASDANFITRDNITLINSKSTKGDDILLDSPSSIDYSAIKVTSSSANSSAGIIYKNVNLINCELQGRLELRAVDSCRFEGKIDFSIGFYHSLYADCKNVDVNIITLGTSKYSNVQNCISQYERVDGIQSKAKLLSTLVELNAPLGSSVLANGTVTISNTSVTAQSHILLSAEVAGVQGMLSYTKNPGVGFTINSSSSTDSSSISWVIFN